MNWPSYLLELNIYITLFYLFYAIVLQKETFFRWNRVYLISSAVLSFSIPLYESKWVMSLFASDNMRQAVRQVNPELLLQEITISANNNNDSVSAWWQWATIIYFIGVFISLVKFIWQLTRISSSFQVTNNALSFFNWIKVSDSLPNRAPIIQHEQVHALQYHSADVMLFELLSIMNWFNPIAYAYKTSIRHIHEYIADEEVSRDTGKEEYSLILVSNAFGVSKEQLTNNFYNKPLLKKRLTMLHKTKSPKAAALKYGLSAPLFIAMVAFSSSKIEADDITLLKEKETAVLKNLTTSISSNFQASAETIESNPPDEFVPTGQSTIGHLDNNKSYTPTRDTSSIYSIRDLETMPEFPGGMSKFYEWVGNNYGKLYTTGAKEAGITGRVIMTFIIEKDGSLSNVKALKDLGYGVGEAAKNLLETSARWKPGIQNGKPVRVQYTLPLIMQLGSSKKAADSLIIVGKNPLANPNPPLIIIDGKESTKEELEAIKGGDIKKLEVIKDKEKIEKYGEKGKNGVIIISTKAKTD